MARPKKNTVRLTDEEVKRLNKIRKNKGTSQTVANRCSILLAVDENHPPAKTYVPYDYDNAELTVLEAIRRLEGYFHFLEIPTTMQLYAEKGLDGTLTLKRSINSDNARRKVDGRTEAKIVQMACGPVPEGHSRWTIRLLEEELKVVLDEPISREAIRRSLKKIGLDLTEQNTGVSPQKQTRNL